MICQCGKEASFDMKFGKIEKYICEHCGRKFGYINEGKATEEELIQFRTAVMGRVFNSNVTDNYRRTVMRLSKGAGNNLKMYSPQRINYSQPGTRRGGN